MRCSTCSETNIENMRYLNKCVVCDNRERREKRDASDVNRARQWEMANWYGITLEERERMAAEQNYCCKVCGKREGVSAFGIDRLQVEHCHTCLAVRGLTCSTCNGRIARHEKNQHVPDDVVDQLDDYINAGCLDDCTTRILVGLRLRNVMA